MLSGKGLCVGLIALKGEPYCGVSVIVKPRQWGGPGPPGAVGPWGRGEIAEVTIGLMCLRKVLVATPSFWFHCLTLSFASKEWHCKAIELSIRNLCSFSAHAFLSVVQIATVVNAT